MERSSGLRPTTSGRRTNASFLWETDDEAQVLGGPRTVERRALFDGRVGRRGDGPGRGGQGRVPPGGTVAPGDGRAPVRRRVERVGDRGPGRTFRAGVG